ncbi:hypothetical protein R6Q57_018083 [Mikania cordata]
MFMWVLEWSESSGMGRDGENRNSGRACRCRRIIRQGAAYDTPPSGFCPEVSVIRHQIRQSIRQGILGDCGEAERARAILGEDTPWTRLFDLAELPSYRLITMEFLSTFRYRAHQAAVRVDEDAELPPHIEFSLCGQHFEMSIERFAVHLGIYYEPVTVTDSFAQGLTQGEEGVMRAWWAQISDTPFTGHRVRATMIRSSGRSRQSVRDGTGHSFHRSRSHACMQTTDRPPDHPDRS